MNLQLREIRDTDLATLFVQQQDAAANHMAAFTSPDPDDEAAFRAKMQRIMAEHTLRPLEARVADGNLGSVRVLEKCGFVVTGEDTGFAHGRGREIRELIMHLK